MANAWLKQMLILALIGGIAAPTLAQNCRRMDDVQSHYDNMRLNEAIRLLEDCRRGNQWEALDIAQKVVALRLLALSYIAKNEMDSSKVAVQELMQENRGYRAPVDDPMIYQNWVNDLRPKAWYQKRWVQLGGLAVVGVLGYLVFGPEEGPQPLAIPTIGPPPQ